MLRAVNAQVLRNNDALRLGDLSSACVRGPAAVADVSPASFHEFSHMMLLGCDCSAEQALADYAVLIDYLKATIPGASESPVVAFGG